MLMEIRRIAKPDVEVCKFEKKKTINSLRLSSGIPVVFTVFLLASSRHLEEKRDQRGGSL